MGRPRKQIQIIEIIELKQIKIETSSERLTKLRLFLAEELKSDNPSLLYMQDLTFSIKVLCEQMDAVW